MLLVVVVDAVSLVSKEEMDVIDADVSCLLLLLLLLLWILLTLLILMPFGLSSEALLGGVVLPFLFKLLFVVGWFGSLAEFLCSSVKSWRNNSLLAMLLYLLLSNSIGCV